MRIPLSWINQFSPLPSLSIKEISRRFTLGSCEVEGVLACAKQGLDAGLERLWGELQVAEVRHIAAHPKSGRLSLVNIALRSSDKTGETQLVCGADNLCIGMKTLWAPQGTEMRTEMRAVSNDGEDDGGNFVLKNKEIQGVLSHGMLCSERELGLSAKHDGIIDLSDFFAKHAAAQKLNLGMSFTEVLARCLQVGQPLQLAGDRQAITDIEFILDVDNKSLTHRPDMWGIYGIAREFGAVFPQLVTEQPIPYGPSPFREIYNRDWQEAQSQAFRRLRGNPESGKSRISLDIAADSCCQSYCALALEGIRVTESPAWLQQRLRLAGLSAINSIVDISNYVMLELGIPNHIFDRDKFEGEHIRVSRLREEQSFETLDGRQRSLGPGDTVVADEARPQAIAGIMGGQNSSVSENTRCILLEVAVWDSHDVHHSSLRLGLRTDSSQRYEKSLDPYSIERSLWRLCQLILEIHPGARPCGGLQSYYRTADTQKIIETSAARIGQVLGYPLDDLGDPDAPNPGNPDHSAGESLVCQIFANLGFRSELREPPVSKGAQSDVQPGQLSQGQKSRQRIIAVGLPSYRTSKDISLEEDLIEEVGRIIGFGNIVPRSPLTELRPTSLPPQHRLFRDIRNFLVLNGHAQEVLSYPLLGAGLLKQAHWHTDAPGDNAGVKGAEEADKSLRLANPLSPEQDRMRPSLIPGHLELVARNAYSNRLRQFCIFELGRSYHASAPGGALEVEEQQHLLISSYSERENPLLRLRNLCERLLRFLGFDSKQESGGSAHSGWCNGWPDWPEFLPATWDGVHPRERLVWKSGQEEQYPGLREARIFRLHPVLSQEFKLKGKLAMACIPLGPVVLPARQRQRPESGKAAVQFQPLQRFPPVEFDCTVVVPPKILAASAVEALYRGAGGGSGRMAELLQKVLVCSVFPASPEDGSRWLTLRCVFADRNATLQSEEIRQLEDRVVAILAEACFPLKGTSKNSSSA